MKQICITVLIVGMASAITAPAFAADTGLNGWGKAYAEAAARKQAEASAAAAATAATAATGSASSAGTARVDVSAQTVSTARPAERPAISLFQNPAALIERPVVIDRAILPERPTIIRPERIAAILR